MSNFQLPKVTILNNDGDAASGAKIYFYIAGTTTPQAVYSDAALTVPRANPVVADSAGRAGEIFLNPDQEYKVKITYADDVELYTIDNIKAYELASGVNIDRLKQVASNPLDYGAIGDGVADESGAVQAAVDAATGTVDLLGLVYRCDSAITLRGDMRLFNGTLDFSQCPDTELLPLAGTIGAAINLTADVEVNERTLALTDTSTLSAGDWLALGSNAEIASGFSDGELVRVRTVDTATQVTLAAPVDSSYATASSANVKLIEPEQNFQADKVKIISDGAPPQSGFVFEYVINSTFRDCVMEGLELSSFKLTTCAHIDISDSVVDISRGVSPSIGIEFTDGSRYCSANSCKIDGAATGISVTGSSTAVTRNISIADCQLSAIGTFGILLATSSADCSVANCNVSLDRESSSWGIYVSGWAISVTGCEIKNASINGLSYQCRRTLDYATPAGGTPAATLPVIRSFSAIGNTISMCNDGISIASDAETVVPGIVLADNTISSVSNDGIALNVDPSSELVDVSITGNVTWDTRRYGIYLRCSGGDLRLLTVTGNCVSQASYGLFLDRASGLFEGVTVSSNTFRDCLSFALQATDITGLAVTGNTLYGPGNSGIFVNDTAGLTIASNILNGFTQTGIYILDSSDVAVSSNQIEDCGAASIWADSYDVMQNIVIDGNTVTPTTVATEGIVVSGTGSGAFLGNVSVSSNVVEMTVGTGIKLTNVDDRFIVSGNNIQHNGTLSTDYGIKLEVTRTTFTSTDFSIHGNLINGSGTGIRLHLDALISTIGPGAISGNTISDVEDHCIKVLVSENIVQELAITGNNLRAAGGTVTSLEAETGAQLVNISVQGNYSVASFGYRGFEVSGAGTAANVFVTGNVFNGGSQAVRENVTTQVNLIAVANLSYNVSAFSSGTWVAAATTATAANLPNWDS